jgi:hypothetical protein
MTFMSELPASDTHDVIHHGGAVVAVVVPIAETEYLARRDAGTIRYVSHEEAGRRLGMSSR